MAIAARISAKCQLLLDETVDLPQGAMCLATDCSSPAENFSSACSFKNECNDVPQTVLASPQRFLARATSRAEARHVGRCLRAHAHRRRNNFAANKRARQGYPVTLDRKQSVTEPAPTMARKHRHGAPLRDPLFKFSSSFACTCCDAPLMSIELEILMAAEETDFALLWRKNAR